MTLGETCEVVNGGTPKTGVPEYWDGKHRWITPAEMGKRLSPYVSETERMISDLGLRNSSAQMLPPHSVILSSRAPIGHLVINTEPMATNQGCKGLIPRSQLQHKFLYYYLSSSVDLLNSLGTGATFKELSGGKLKEVTLPVPPLAEQQRIVGLLDEAFAGLATAKANAEKNLQNARALFESHLQSVFTHRGKGWVKKRFDEVCVLQRGFDLPTHERNKGQYPLVSSNGITDSIDLWKVKSPGVVTGRSGTIGNVHFIEEDFWPLNTALYIKNFHGNHEKFVFYFLKQFNLSKYSSGAGVPTLNRNNVHGENVYFPESLSEQKLIAFRLDSLNEETQHLESAYQQKLDALEELKKALLHQAFTGEL